MQQNIDLIDLLRALNAEGAKYRNNSGLRSAREGEPAVQCDHVRYPF